jgi:hypothetical protein
MHSITVTHARSHARARAHTHTQILRPHKTDTDSVPRSPISVFTLVAGITITVHKSSTDKQFAFMLSQKLTMKELLALNHMPNAL